MIDLHSHILPGVDDGATSVEDSLAMARMAVEDGIEVMACTPHFMPGLYDNEASDIRARVEAFNSKLTQEGISLALVAGSDAHVRPDFLQCLRDGRILTLHDSRYVLFEPPHNIQPPRLEDLLFNLTVSGFVPILTHPERLKWIENSYATFQNLAKSGVWMQITAGSLTGRFGKRPQYWAQRMLSEGLVSILATDAHNVRSRPPLLREGLKVAASELGAEEAEHLVFTRPLGVLEDRDPGTLPALLEPEAAPQAKASLWRRIFGAQA